MPDPAAGEATVVVHFHKWDDDYTNVGGHSWGGEVLVKVGDEWKSLAGSVPGSVQPTGEDDFGIYFTYRFEAKEDALDLGFIPVMANEVLDDGSIVPNWDRKMSEADVLIPVKEYAAGSEHHVYVFEGSRGKNADPEAGEFPFLIANPEKVNLITVFYDPNNNYHENLGVHSWNWDADYNSGEWGTPLQIFKDVAKVGETPVKAAILAADAATVGTSGFLVYNGDNKYTGNIDKEVTPNVGIYADDVANGLVVPMYILSAGEGNESNNNLYYGENLDEFKEEAFSFKFELGNYSEGKGTFAFNKNIVYTKLNQDVNTNFTKLDDTEKTAKKAELMDLFSIVEVVNDVETENTIEIVEINFNESVDAAREFVLTLKSDLDHTKNYRVKFEEKVDEALIPKERTIKFEVTAPEGTPNVYIVGLADWEPGRSNWKMTKDAETGKFTLEVKATLAEKTLQFKYVYGPAWTYEQAQTDNYELVIGSESVIEVKHNVEWKTAPDPDTVYEAELEAKLLADDEFDIDNVPLRKAHADLEMDKEAPNLIFITDFDEQEGEIGVVQIEQYSKWDQTLFPRFSVNDNRDGDITHRVHVPEDTEFKILDTNRLGDQKILLRVEDDWGHIKEVIFIFRVVAKK